MKPRTGALIASLGVGVLLWVGAPVRADDTLAQCQQWLKISGSFASDRKAEIDQYQVEIAKLKVTNTDLQDQVQKLQKENGELKQKLPKEEPKK